MSKAGELHSITEYRVVLPLDVEEYRTGLLWSVAQASKHETGGGEGVEIVTNEPFQGRLSVPMVLGGKEYTTGQYTHKIIHLASKVPSFIRLLAPKGSFEVFEKSWNSYPYCRTEYSNAYMKSNFYVVVETFYAANDRGTSENIHELEGRDLDERVVVDIDVTGTVTQIDYNADSDPTKVRSEKAGRGPLPAGQDGEWQKKVEPVMCCYKVVKVYFKWWGLQTRVESIILRALLRLFKNFHRQSVCWLDNYYGLTMEQIRKVEEETKEELAELRVNGEVRGMVEK